MIAFASKKKKAVREELLQLRSMAADWKVRNYNTAVLIDELTL